MNSKSIFTKISQYKYLIFFVFQMFFFIGHSFAGTTALGNDIFTPVSQDSSLAILQELFGGLISGNFGGTSADPLLGGIKAFNGAVLTIGGILIAYTIIYGTIGTAHDGEMLGKKFSSVWIPIRTSIGAALVLPVVGGGYCLMQVIVMWLVIQGVGLADQVWQSYVTNIPANALLKAFPPAQVPPQNVQDLANNIFQMTTCMEANKLQAAYTTDPSNLAQAAGSMIVNLGEGTVGQNYGMSTYQDKANNTTDYGFGITGTTGLGKAAAAAVAVVGDPIAAIGGLSSAGLSQQICGHVNGVPVTPPDKAGTTGMFDDYVLTDLSPLQTAKNTALLTLINSSITLSDNLSNSVISAAKNPPTPPTYTDLQAEALNYYNSEVTAANTILNPGSNSPAFKDVINATNLHGWLYAGTFFNQLINFNNTVNSSINQLPDSSSVPAGVVPIMGANSFSSNLNKIGENMKNILTGLNNPSSSSIPDISKKEKEKIQENQTTPTGIFAKWINKIVVGTNLNDLKDDNRNPIVILGDMGNRLIYSSFGAIASLLVTAGLASILSTSLGMTIALMAVPIIVFMLSIGFISGYLIPFLPFMIFTGAALGWLIMVVEAIIAAPLWAVMHLHPEGHDITGHGHSGYMLVLGLLLRPVLLIFGFISAVALMNPIGHFINSIFFSAFASSQQDSVGFFGEIFGLAIYAGFMYTAVKTIFSVIHRIPDQLLRWIGGGGDNLGEFSQQHVEGSKAMGVAVGSALGSSIGHISSSAQQAYANYKNDKSKEDESSRNLMNSGNKIEQLRGQSGKAVHDNLIDGISGGSQSQSSVGHAYAELMTDLQNNSIGQSETAENFESKVEDAISNGGLSSNSLTAVSQLNNLANQAKQEGIAKFGNDLSNDLPNLGTQLVSNMSIANATSTARNFAEVLGQNSKVTDSVKSLVNNGDFDGALKELNGGGSNGGGSAGNPKGSTPNAGGSDSE